MDFRSKNTIHELQLRNTGFEGRRRGRKTKSVISMEWKQTNPGLGRRLSLSFQGKKNMPFENHVFPQLWQRQEGCQPEHGLCRNLCSSCSLVAVSKEQEQHSSTNSWHQEIQGRRSEDHFSKLCSLIWFIRSDWIVNSHANVRFYLMQSWIYCHCAKVINSN